MLFSFIYLLFIFSVYNTSDLAKRHILVGKEKELKLKWYKREAKRTMSNFFSFLPHLVIILSLKKTCENACMIIHEFSLKSFSCIDTHLVNYLEKKVCGSKACKMLLKFVKQFSRIQPLARVVSVKNYHPFFIFSHDSQNGSSTFSSSAWMGKWFSQNFSFRIFRFHH